MSTRFYQHVGTAQDGSSWVVLLDDKPIKTPAGDVLQLPSLALAELIASEWAAQTKTVLPSTMPLTKLANVAHDHMDKAHGASADELVRFANADLLCFRVTTPLALREVQAAKWDGWLGWAEQVFGAKLGVSNDLQLPAHPPQAVQNMRQMAMELHPFALTALVHVTSILGSAILGFALLQGKVNAKNAFDLSRVEENWQIKHWGEDDEAKARADGLFAALSAAVDFMRASNR
ncbi:MAG: hypothetical protein JKX99_00995 [Robiginitomaculum sp.]|nr:hypothetical protein [Robiginitomaculum sp.]